MWTILTTAAGRIRDPHAVEEPDEVPLRHRSTAADEVQALVAAAITAALVLSEPPAHGTEPEAPNECT